MTSNRKIRTVFLMVTFLAAASSPDRTASAGENARDTPPSVTLNVWIMNNAQTDNERHFLDLVQAFSDANPTIKVVPTVLPWAVSLDRIQSALGGGPAPDITQLGTTWVAAIASTGKLADLTGQYDDKVFRPQVLTTTTIGGPGSHDGKRFAMPWIVDTRALYYNKAACAKAGVNPAKDFATWASFKVALGKPKGVEVDGRRLQPLWIATSNWNVIHSMALWIWGAGGDLVPNANGTGGVNAPAAVAGIDYCIDLVRAGLAVLEADAKYSQSVEVMLRAGELATAIAPPIPALPDSRFGVASVPEGPKGRFTFLGGSALAVLKSSKHPKEATALIKFLSGEGAQIRYSTVTGYLPAVAAEYDELLLKLDPIRGAFVEQMRYGRAYPSIPQWGQIEIVLRDGFTTIWETVRKPGAYDKLGVHNQLDAMARRIDAILRASTDGKSD